MSYILEALRKSERERSLGKVPTLETTSQSAPRRSSAWLLLLLLLLLAGGVAWWFWQNQLPVSDRTHLDEMPAGQSDPAPEPAHAGATSDEPQAKMSEPGLSDANPLDPGTIVLNVISWSEDPARRFAMINQKIVREGEVLPNGMTVRLIAPDKVVVINNDRELVLKP